MKRSIILVGIMILFLLALTLILPSKISVARTTVINAPENKISTQISDFAQWENWFPILKSKLATLVISNDSNAIIKRNSGEEIKVRVLNRSKESITFTTTIASGSNAIYTVTIKSLPDSTFRVNMIVNTNLKWYPWEKAKGVFLDKVSGPQYEEALKNLKVYCESPEQ